MISIWYHSWQKQEPHSAEEMLSIHFILDVELIYRLNDLRESSFYYIGMFHQRYRECVKGERIVEWDRLKVPIETWKDFLTCCDKNRLKSLDANSSVAAFATIGYAGGCMFEEFKRIQGGSK